MTMIGFGVGGRGGCHSENNSVLTKVAQKLKKKRRVEQNSEVLESGKIAGITYFGRERHPKKILLKGRYVSKTGKLRGHTICT